jgi:hypothetical protein
MWFNQFKEELNGKLKARIFTDYLTHQDGETELIKIAILMNYFLVGDGKTIAEAQQSLERVILGTLAGNKSFNTPALYGIKPPPQKYFEAPYELEYEVNIFSNDH